MTDTTRSVLVILEDGARRRVSNIPKDAKITYGPVQPGKGDYHTKNALRIYTSASNQLAVFVGVKEFRDESLVVQEQKVSRQAKSTKSKDGESSCVNESVEWDDDE